MSHRACARLGVLAVIILMVLLLLYSQTAVHPGSANGTLPTNSQYDRDQPQHSPNASPDTVLVGQRWGAPDPAGIPDVVKLNMDDNSLPRLLTAGGGGDLQQLLPNLVPAVVHFTWCGNRWFEFKPYLSILSVIRTVKPDKLLLHYESPPQQDKLYYHTWLEDLAHDFPFFEIQQMTLEQTRICHGMRNDKVQAIAELLRTEGGIYVGENTWMLEFPATNRHVDLDLSLSSNSIEGYVILRPGVYTNNNTSLETLAAELGAQSERRVRRQECATTTQLYNGLQRPHCLLVNDPVFGRFYPSDIWRLEDAFGAVARRIFYGTERVLRPMPSYDTLVPNIGHMIWIGGRPMDFVFYLSVLSMLGVLRVDTVYIHGDVPPTGPYWARLMTDRRLAPRVRFVTRPQPLMVYQGTVQPWYRALMSDIIRVDIMIKYGGIYADTDAIWARPLSREDRGYDAVASYDWVDWSFPYPDSVNFGLSYGKRNAPFWRLFRDTMRTLHNDLHGFTGVMKPYKILEKFPHLLRIDRHLQVICYQFRCHPTWVKDYHNQSIDHVTTGSLNNWRESVNAFHWTHPNPPELTNETTLAASSGIFADLARMVLAKAKLL